MEKMTLHREPEGYKLFDAVLKDFRNSRQKIYLCMAVATLLTVLIVLLVPNEYKSTARVMPESGSPANRLAELASSIVPSDLLSSAIMPDGGSESEKLKGLFTSNRIADALLAHQYTNLALLENGNLYFHYDIEHKEYARAELWKNLTLNENKKSGIISISAVTKDPVLSAQLANQAVNELDRFKLELSVNDARENKEFYITQLEKFENDLLAAEEIQAEFLAKNKNYLTSTDPVLRQKVSEYEAQVLFNTKIVYGMKQLIVAAETEINRNTPTIKIIEEAEVPLLKFGPPRTKYVLFAFFGSFLFAFGIILTKNAYSYYFPDNSKQELASSVTTVRNDLHAVVNRLNKRNSKEVVK